MADFATSLEVIISAVQLRVAIRIGWAFWMATGYPNESDEKIVASKFPKASDAMLRGKLFYMPAQCRMH
jgi:hypothetical protein